MPCLPNSGQGFFNRYGHFYNFSTNTGTCDYFSNWRFGRSVQGIE